MNNRGQGFQMFLPFLLIGIILVVAFAMIMIPMAVVGDEIDDALKETTAFGDNELSVQAIDTVGRLRTTAFDQTIFLFLIGLIIATIIFGIFTDFSPVVIGILIIALILFAIVAGLMAQTFNQVEETPLLAEKASEFTFTNLVLGTQFPIIIVIVIAIAIIIILAKRGRVVTPV